MRSLNKTIRAVYGGYKGDKERHIFRLSAMAFVGAIISYFPTSLNKDALSMIGAMVSILAGFTFTALFSGHYHSVHDLPEPQDESDRADVDKLKKLFVNFQDRSKYFILTAVICLLFCLILLVPFNINFFISSIFKNISSEMLYIISKIWYIICFAGRFFCINLFFELIYTFYRMSQTIFSIIETRRAYFEQIRQQILG
jgi:hypothetical protein